MPQISTRGAECNEQIYNIKLKSSLPGAVELLTTGRERDAWPAIPPAAAPTSGDVAQGVHLAVELARPVRARPAGRFFTAQERRKSGKLKQFFPFY